jgi:hypothetical protein
MSNYKKCDSITDFSLARLQKNGMVNPQFVGAVSARTQARKKLQRRLQNSQDEVSPDLAGEPAIASSTNCQTHTNQVELA